jgi:hypothetical protein
MLHLGPKFMSVPSGTWTEFSRVGTLEILKKDRFPSLELTEPLVALRDRSEEYRYLPISIYFVRRFSFDFLKV